MIRQYISDPEKKDLIQVIDALRDIDNEDRFDILLDIANHNLIEFTNVVYELIMIDDDPAIRATAFWVLAQLSDEKGAERLVEAIEEEDNDEARRSMIDTLRGFILSHDIEVKGISLIENHQEKTIDERTEIKEFYPKYEIKIEDPVTKARTRLKRNLLELSPNIPISLTRLADLSGVTERSLDRYLREISNSHAGKYYPLEQVFIKERLTNAQVLEPQKKREPTCPDCGAISIRYPCAHCNEGLQCMICKLMIGDHEEMTSCQNCGNKAHRKHLQEWARIKSDCPLCKEKLIVS